MSQSPGQTASSVHASLSVLHLSSGNLYGGVERIITALSEFRHLCGAMRPRFALAFEGRQAEELRAAETPPSILGGVRLSRPVSVIRARRALGRILDELRPDIVVCHNPWALVVYGPAVRRRAIPLVEWVHGALSGRPWLERWARRTRPDLVIANSVFTAGTVSAVFPGAPVDVVYAPARFPQTDQGARQRVREMLGASPRSIVVLQVSRIEPTKGHIAHLRALARLPRDVPWLAWFVGAAQRDQERQLMAELGMLVAELELTERVRFLGERSDIHELLAAADVFCQPNATPDAFGLSFVEAMAAGVPVLTTRLGGALEIVDESCGVLVPADDREALAAALTRLVIEPEFRRSRSAGGPARARQLCDPAVRLGDLHASLLRAMARSIPPQRGRS